MKTLKTLFILLFISAAAGSQTLIPSGSIWKYLANGSNQGNAWSAPNFYDAVWNSGAAKLGYGDPVVTTVPYGSSINKYITTYFRKTFLVSNPSTVTSLDLSIMRDDGAAVYINGQEVYRTNLVAGALYNTLAASSVDGTAETTWYSVSLSPSLLVSGTNTIAVEVHQRSGASSDMTFDLKLIAQSTISSCAIPNSASFLISNITSTSATVSWTTVSGASSYNFMYGPSGGTQSVLTTSTNFINLTGLLPATSYTFSAQTVCEGSVSAYTNMLSFTTLSGTTGTCATPNPVFFTCVNKTANSATCRWATVSGALSYNFKYGPRGGVQTTLSASINSINLSGLSPSTNYDFYVQSVCGGGTSAFSSYGTFTTLAGSATCGITSSTNFTNTNITSSSVRCTWVSVSGAISYNFMYGPPGGVQVTLSSLTNSMNLSGLVPSTVYNYSVQTVCSGFTSTFSGIGTFTTLSGSTSSCAIANPATFTITNLTSTSAIGGWSSVNGALSYNFKYGPRGGTQITLSTLTNSISLSGLSASTIYDFYVQTVCSGGTGNYSTYGTFTTPTGTSAALVIRGPYLQVAGTSTITIQWRTNIATNSEVKVGTSIQNLISNSTNATFTTEHIIQVSGLQPATQYYYSVGAIGQIQQGDASNYFLTAPATGSAGAVRFWVTGDFGNGSSTQIAVRDAYANYSTTSPTNGWLWLGDNAYSNGTDNEYQLNVFNKYPSQLKKYPLFPSLGNHDYAQSGYLSSIALGTNHPYFSIFSAPTNSGSEKYYSYNYGNVHFVVLDSYGSYNTIGSPMYNWLLADLQANTQRWLIAYFHHPPYSKGSHDSDISSELIDMRQNIIPLLEQYGVDLVLSGHSHSYERSMFIRGHTGISSTFNSAIYPAGNVVSNSPGVYPNYYSKTSLAGTVYVVCGTSGEINGVSAVGYPHLAMQYSNLSTAGSLVLDIDGDRLDCKYLTTTGSIPDEFTIIKSYAPFARLAATKEKTMTVFPNPSNGIVNIQCPEIMGVVVQVVSMNGKIRNTSTYEKISAGENIQVDLRNESTGIYFIRIMHQNGEEMHRVIRN